MVELIPLSQELISNNESPTFSEQRERGKQTERYEQIRARRKAGKWNCCEIITGEDGQSHQCSRIISSNKILCADHAHKREEARAKTAELLSHHNQNVAGTDSAVFHPMV